MGRRKVQVIDSDVIEKWLQQQPEKLSEAQQRLLAIAQAWAAGDTGEAIGARFEMSRQRVSQLVAAFRHQAGCEDGSWAVVWSLVCLMAASIAALVAWLLASGGTPWPVTALATGATFVGIIIMVGVLIAWGA